MVAGMVDHHPPIHRLLEGVSAWFWWLLSFARLFSFPCSGLPQYDCCGRGDHIRFTCVVL